MFNPKDAPKVKGYETLGVNTKMFEQFLQNFMQAWGLEARETIVPVSIQYCKDIASGAYLKFIYKIYGHKEWLHVKNPATWY